MFWQFDRFPVLRNTYYFVDALPFSCYHCEYINHEKECNYTEVCSKGEDVSLLNFWFVWLVYVSNTTTRLCHRQKSVVMILLKIPESSLEQTVNQWIT
jgi:hypothetical protein